MAMGFIELVVVYMGTVLFSLFKKKNPFVLVSFFSTFLFIVVVYIIVEQ